MKRVIVGGAACALLVGAGSAAAVGFGGNPATQPAAPAAPATTTVTRATLTQTEQVDGTLDYGTTTTIKAESPAGTLTWLAAAGATIHRGGTVYRVDQDRVPLIYGTVPLYRVLVPGEHGADVAELERNLAALGYTGFTVDNTYTAATASAVRSWQDDLNLPRTGTVAPGAVVVAPGEIRISQLRASLGDPASGPVVDYTGTVRTVAVALDVSLQDLVHDGVPATITVPNQTTVSGTVTDVGRVATAGAGQSDNGNGNGNGNGNPPTIAVTISVSEQRALGTLDSAPVTVELTSAHADNVLSVPVQALVALAEGGYGVQVITGDASRYVAVHTGMFANGRVEITGHDISAGTIVGIPGD